MRLSEPQYIERFESYFDKAPGVCWNWKGAVTTAGYGQFHVGGKNRITHRLSFELYKGPIAHGMVIDHLCRNRKCQNPEHMELVTPRENVLRGISFAALNAKKEYCKNGHKFEGHNLIVTPVQRMCRKCHALSEIRQRHGKTRSCDFCQKAISIGGISRHLRLVHSSLYVVI